MLRAGLAAYGALADQNYGEAGNQITATVTAQSAEVAPTTGAFTYVPSPQATAISLRVNGGAVQTIAVAAKTSPASLVGTVESTANQSFNSLTTSSLNQILAVGGQNRGTIDAAVVSSGQTLALAASGTNITLTLNTGTWAVTPTVGDTLIIPANTEYGAAANSVVIGAGSANAGGYVITSVTSSTISATKLRDNAGTSLTNPVNVAATDIVNITDIMCFAPITAYNLTGTERSVLTGLVGQTVAGAVSGSTLTLTLQTGQVWASLPQAGDLVLMPATAPSAWRASNTNGGWYQVTSSTSGSAAGQSTIVLTRLSNGNPASFAATAIAAVTDLRVFRPAIDGVGKTLEIFDGSGTESISVAPFKFFNLSTTPVTWISTAVAPQLLVSASEYVSLLTTARTADGISESISGSGDVVLKVGYHGNTSVTTATLTISGTTLTTTVSGGTGSNLTVDLTKYATLADLAAYINSQSGYTASVSTALFGQQQVTYQATATAKATVLDKGTWGIASSHRNQVGRIKKDAYAFFKNLSANSVLVQLGTGTTPAAASAGQPEVQALTFLAGGTKGVTTNARVTGAIDAMERVRGNFLVTLFSRDASIDATEGLTDSGSTYTIDSINAYAKSHVVLMSQVKRKRHRQAFLSYKNTFVNAKLAAANIASARCSMAFQDFKSLDSQGNVKQFAPWLGACFAAGMQAAGFYKAIFKKFINCSGVLMADGTYSDQMVSQVEDGLQNGLLPAERAETGGFRWVSDQTTYGVDGNFVYNSIQAVYAMDTVALTIAQRLEQAFVGQSLADISAGLMLSYIKAIMSDLMRLKLIASSDDAPLGFKDAVVQISGNAAKVSLNIKLATSLYFIPIQAYISQITQTAAQ
jgi:hypothetical protein